MKGQAKSSKGFLWEWASKVSYLGNNWAPSFPYEDSGKIPIQKS